MGMLCALGLWRLERPETDDPALFVAWRVGHRLTTEAIGKVIESITSAAGLDDRVTAPVYRPSRANASCHSRM